MRFSIRDVLWLTVVAGLSIGWAIDHWRLDERARIKNEQFVDFTLDLYLEIEDAKEAAEQAKRQADALCPEAATNNRP